MNRFEMSKSAITSRYKNSWLRWALNFTAIGTVLERDELNQDDAGYALVQAFLNSSWFFKRWFFAYIPNQYKQDFTNTLSICATLQAHDLLTRDNCTAVTKLSNGDNFYSVFMELMRKEGLLTQVTLTAILSYPSRSLASILHHLSNSIPNLVLSAGIIDFFKNRLSAASHSELGVVYRELDLLSSLKMKNMDVLNEITTDPVHQQFINEILDRTHKIQCNKDLGHVSVMAGLKLLYNDGTFWVTSWINSVIAHPYPTEYAQLLIKLQHKNLINSNDLNNGNVVRSIRFYGCTQAIHLLLDNDCLTKENANGIACGLGVLQKEYRINVFNLMSVLKQADVLTAASAVCITTGFGTLSLFSSMRCGENIAHLWKKIIIGLKAESLLTYDNWTALLDKMNMGFALVSLVLRDNLLETLAHLMDCKLLNQKNFSDVITDYDNISLLDTVRDLHHANCLRQPNFDTIKHEHSRFKRYSLKEEIVRESYVSVRPQKLSNKSHDVYFFKESVLPELMNRKPIMNIK